MATLRKGYMNAQECAEYERNEQAKMAGVYLEHRNHTGRRKEAMRDIYRDRARLVGLSLVTYCKRFNVRGVLYKGEVCESTS